jgi:hypothetical protein
MSEQESGKKTREEMELERFLEAYEWTTGESLRVLKSSERPDFVCFRPDGSRMGVELVKVTRDPQSRWADEALSGRQYMQPGEAIDWVCAAIEVKESKRQEQDWSHRESMILVVQLVDCRLSSLVYLLESVDCEDHGFREIWIADYAGLEPYGIVELFGLHPLEWRGHHERYAGRKPYG